MGSRHFITVPEMFRYAPPEKDCKISCGVQAESLDVVRKKRWNRRGIVLCAMHRARKALSRRPFCLALIVSCTMHRARTSAPHLMQLVSAEQELQAPVSVRDGISQRSQASLAPLRFLCARGGCALPALPPALLPCHRSFWGSRCAYAWSMSCAVISAFLHTKP